MRVCLCLAPPGNRRSRFGGALGARSAFHTFVERLPVASPRGGPEGRADRLENPYSPECVEGAFSEVTLSVGEDPVLCHRARPRFHPGRVLRRVARRPGRAQVGDGHLALHRPPDCGHPGARAKRPFARSTASCLRVRSSGQDSTSRQSLPSAKISCSHSRYAALSQGLDNLGCWA